MAAAQSKVFREASVYSLECCGILIGVVSLGLFNSVFQSLKKYISIHILCSGIPFFSIYFKEIIINLHKKGQHSL